MAKREGHFLRRDLQSGVLQILDMLVGGVGVGGLVEFGFGVPDERLNCQLSVASPVRDIHEEENHGLMLNSVAPMASLTYNNHFTSTHKGQFDPSFS